MDTNEFEKFFKEREASLVKAIGEEHWREEKLYFTHEVIDIVKEWELHKMGQHIKKQNTMLPKDLTHDELMFAMRASCFHMSDEEAKLVVDWYIQEHPELLDVHDREWYYKNI